MAATITCPHIITDIGCDAAADQLRGPAPARVGQSEVLPTGDSRTQQEGDRE